MRQIGMLDVQWPGQTMARMAAARICAATCKLRAKFPLAEHTALSHDFRHE
jgi:hypothetical protein